MKNTAIFLAKQWSDTDELFYKVIAMAPEDGIEYLINNYYVIQGTYNQIRLRKLASEEFDSSEISKEIEQIIKE